MAKRARKIQRIVITASHVTGEGKELRTHQRFFAHDDRYCTFDPAAIADAEAAARHTFAQERGIAPTEVTVATAPRSARPGYRFSYRQTAAETADAYNKRRAIDYARWIASRDGIAINAGLSAQVEWSGFYSANSVTTRGEPAYCKRIKAVEFGTKRKEYLGTGRHRRIVDVWDVKHRIEIPNWDFDPAPPVEETIADTLVAPSFDLAPVVPSRVSVPPMFLRTSRLVRVHFKCPVAPSCVIRLAA